jgi:hypothetical protein
MSNSEEKETMIAMTAHTLNASPNPNTRLAIRQILLNVKADDLSPVKQLSRFVSCLIAANNCLQLNVHATFCKSCPECFTMGKFFNLKTVSLDTLPEEKQEFEFWRGVSQLQTLQKIKLKGDRSLYDDRVLAPLVEMPMLKTLVFSIHAQIYDNTWEHLRKLTQLKAFQFKNGVSDEVAEIISHMPLEKLTLKKLRISSEAFQNMTKISTLQNLRMSFTVNPDGNYKGISKLKNLRSFRTSDRLCPQSMQELSTCPLEYLFFESFPYYSPLLVGEWLTPDNPKKVLDKIWVSRLCMLLPENTLN